MNILERHNELDATIGFLKMEEESLERAFLFSWIFFPSWIILTVVQGLCFVLYNGRFHPLAKILDDPDDTINESKYKIQLNKHFIQ